MKHNISKHVTLKGTFTAPKTRVRDGGLKSVTSGFTVRNQKKDKSDPK